MAEAFERIWEAVAAIPPGATLSYGEVARRAGLPRRARMVGSALGAAPRELALPWHRVILASGRIAFPPGSKLFRKQAELLRREGVLVDKKGGVSSGEPASLDAELWGPD